jgi:hypothetical protein
LFPNSKKVVIFGKVIFKEDCNIHGNILYEMPDDDFCPLMHNTLASRSEREFIEVSPGPNYCIIDSYSFEDSRGGSFEVNSVYDAW